MQLQSFRTGCCFAFGSDFTKLLLHTPHQGALLHFKEIKSTVLLCNCVVVFLFPVYILLLLLLLYHYNIVYDSQTHNIHSLCISQGVNFSTLYRILQTYLQIWLDSNASFQIVIQCKLIYRFGDSETPGLQIVNWFSLQSVPRCDVIFKSVKEHQLAIEKPRTYQ